LGESGAAVASLGVVPGTVMEPVSAARLPAPIRWLTLRLPGALASIYDFGGLETFRKRFRPQRWESIYLAVAREDGAAPGTRDWLRVLLSLGRAFEPRLVPSLEPLRIALSRHLARHAVSSLVLLASLAVFAGVNHWGELPPAALSRYGFWAGAPAAQWIYRSFTSDFFYFGALHFCAVVPLYWLAIRWAERTHARAFVIAYFLGVAFFDDVINYLAIVRPFSYLEPEFFTRLIAHEDVGGSLGLMAFLGLQICQFRRNRELIFAGAALVVVLGHAFASEHRQAMMLNLDHFVFLILGYVSGKLKFEYDRRRSRAAARGKSPVARPARS
jgi:hypothetical protein